MFLPKYIMDRCNFEDRKYNILFNKKSQVENNFCLVRKVFISQREKEIKFAENNLLTLAKWKPVSATRHLPDSFALCTLSVKAEFVLSADVVVGVATKSLRSLLTLDTSLWYYISLQFVGLGCQVIIEQTNNTHTRSVSGWMSLSHIFPVGL